MDKKRVKNPTGMLVMHGLVIAVVVYMYAQIVKNYLAGGEGAPSLALLLGSGVVLLAGCGVIGYLALRLYRQAKRETAEIEAEAAELEKTFRGGASRSGETEKKED